MAFNKVILMGRLTANPELKQTPNGVTVTSFSLAVDRKGKDSSCDFIPIVAWRQTAEFICKYFKKGQAILVCGELQTRSWTDNNGQKRYATDIIIDEVQFVDSKNDAQQTGSSRPTNYMPEAYTSPQMAKFEDIKQDVDLPFN